MSIKLKGLTRNTTEKIQLLGKTLSLLKKILFGEKENVASNCELQQRCKTNTDEFTTKHTEKA